MYCSNIISTVVMLSLLQFSACGGDSAAKRVSEKRAQATKATADLVSTFNASMDWDVPFTFDAFSSDLERALVRSDGRPVLITGDVKDIQGDLSSPLLLIEHQSPHALSLDLVAALRCTPEQAEKFRNARIGPVAPAVAVVARIDSLVHAETARARLGLDENARWLATGSCLGLEPIGIGGQLFVYPSPPSATEK